MSESTGGRARRAVARHPRVAAAAALGAAALLAIVLVWFQPQKLVIDERVNEDLPAALASPAESAAPTATATAVAGPRVLSAAPFRPLAHGVEGEARLVRLADGRLIIRFEGFSVENGPDLFVYLSAAPASSEEDDAFARDFVNLGRLKGNQGNQNYVVPADADLARYRSVVVWCRRFSVGFAAAAVEAPTAEQ